MQTLAGYRPHLLRLGEQTAEPLKHWSQKPTQLSWNEAIQLLHRAEGQAFQTITGAIK